MCKIQRLIWKLEGLDSPERLYSSQSSCVRSELFVFPGLLLGLWLNNQLWLALQLLPGNDITLLLFLVFVWGREADGWKGLHLCVCTCARSWLTISHPELWQPYSSVVGWQLLLNSDIELQKKGKQSTGQKFLIETNKSLWVKNKDCGWNGSWCLESAVNVPFPPPSPSGEQPDPVPEVPFAAAATSAQTESTVWAQPHLSLGRPQVFPLLSRRKVKWHELHHEQTFLP